jgi:hypothetical protein
MGEINLARKWMTSLRRNSGIMWDQTDEKFKGI